MDKSFRFSDVYLRHSRFRDRQNPLLTPADVAERLNVARTTVYRLIEAGDLRAIRIGGGEKSALRVFESELQRFIRDRLETGANEE